MEEIQLFSDLFTINITSLVLPAKLGILKGLIWVPDHSLTLPGLAAEAKKERAKVAPFQTVYPPQRSSDDQVSAKYSLGVPIDSGT